MEKPLSSLRKQVLTKRKQRFFTASRESKSLSSQPQVADQKTQLPEKVSETKVSLDAVYLNLIKVFSTLSEVNKGYRYLKESVEEVLYHAASPEKETGGLNTYDQENLIFKQWGQETAKQLLGAGISVADYKDFFQGLREKLDNTTKLVVYVPFVSTNVETAKILSFARSRIHSEFILDLKYDPDLIAGCAFVWKGTYKDFSLRSRISDNRDPIRKVLANFNQN